MYVQCMYISVNSFIHQVSALCLEVQESESATVVTFSPYYPGCVPVQIINHFTDVTLHFKQDTKYVKLNACQKLGQVGVLWFIKRG